MSKVTQYLDLTTSVLSRIVKPKVSRVTIPVTYTCNQKCRTCGVWEINKKDPSKKANELTLDEFTAFCEVNKPLWIALTGGETFLRKDMADITAVACRNAHFVSIVTNGSVTDKIVSDVQRALEAPKSKATLTISVSFNGPEEVHDSIAGVSNSYKKALETYTRLLRLRNSRLRMNISYTSSCFNAGKFIQFSEEFPHFPGIAGVTYLVAQDSPSYFRTDWSVVTPPEVSETLGMIKSLLPTYKVKTIFDFIGKKYMQGYLTGKRVGCVAGRYNLMFDPYWNVYPCMFFCPTQSIGNLRELGWDLRNLDYQKSKDLVKSCKVQCWTPCETYPTMLFRPWRAL